MMTNLELGELLLAHLVCAPPNQQINTQPGTPTEHSAGQTHSAASRIAHGEIARRRARSEPATSWQNQPQREVRTAQDGEHGLLEGDVLRQQHLSHTQRRAIEEPTRGSV
jgi:hypothetical protein